MPFLRNKGSKIDARKDASCLLDTNWSWQVRWKWGLVIRYVSGRLRGAETEHGVLCARVSSPASGEEPCGGCGAPLDRIGCTSQRGINTSFGRILLKPLAVRSDAVT